MVTGWCPATYGIQVWSQGIGNLASLGREAFLCRASNGLSWVLKGSRFTYICGNMETMALAGNGSDNGNGNGKFAE